MGFFSNEEKLEQFEDCIDQIRGRFGHWSVRRAASLVDSNLHIDAAEDNDTPFLPFNKVVGQMAATYLKVMASFSEVGEIMPVAFEWPDGRKFAVDRVLDVSKSASRKMGGAGMRYRCRVMGKEVILFLDGSKWFCEV